MRSLGFFMLALTACQPDTPQAPPVLGVELAPNGLNVPNSALEVGFDRARAGAEIALAKLMGRPVERVRASATCPYDQIRWRNGLVTNFTATAFVGWQTGLPLSLYSVADGVDAPFAGRHCV